MSDEEKNQAPKAETKMDHLLRARDEALQAESPDVIDAARKAGLGNPFIADAMRMALRQLGQQEETSEVRDYVLGIEVENARKEAQARALADDVHAIRQLLERLVRAMEKDSDE